MLIQQIEEYVDLIDFNTRFQLLYIDVQHLIDFFIIVRRYVSAFKFKIKTSIKIVLNNKSNMKLNKLMTLTKTFEVIYILSSTREHNKKSINIIVFIDENINDNFNIIKKNIKYYNYKDSNHKSLECINFYVSEYTLKN